MSIKKVAAGVGMALGVGAEVLRRKATSYDSEIERRQWFQRWAKDLVIPLFDRAGTNVVGLERIPDDGPYIFAPKHVYNSDPFTAAHAVLRREPDLELMVLAKHQIESWPIISDLIYGTAVYVDRVRSDAQHTQDRDSEIFNKMGNLAKETVRVPGGRGATIIHPEGTFEPLGVLPMKKGVILASAKMALELGRPVPIIPIGMANNSVIRYAKGIVSGKCKNKIEITIGDPIWVDESIIEDFMTIRDPETGELWRSEHPNVKSILNELRLQILYATNESRLRSDLEPIELIDAPSGELRARRIGTKAIQG